ncbi:MAG TPA: hypothetical protein VGO94_08965 [Mycobacteriales bacterium]|jgi:hypothetical protein|nr:hypothetical protein [Cryptosporangiaceae bacterium]MDQ1677238.1 hypothetical protein [Actinomycetota bacterium]HEV7755977.1 hypothetical protein [Mycobacteriales bacterium]
MRRLFWLGVGLAAGALAVRTLTKKAEAFTPTGISESLQSTATDLLESVKDFVDEVRMSMAERESELYAALAGEIDVDEAGRGDRS